MTESFDEALMDEACGWISEMLEEEGAYLDPGLIFIILEKEWAVLADDPRPVQHPEMAQRLIEALEADGIQGVPDAITPHLVVGVLSWEDEFLALAGRTRPGAT